MRTSWPTSLVKKRSVGATTRLDAFFEFFDAYFGNFRIGVFGSGRSIRSLSPLLLFFDIPTLFTSREMVLRTEIFTYSTLIYVSYLRSPTKIRENMLSRAARASNAQDDNYGPRSCCLFIHLQDYHLLTPVGLHQLGRPQLESYHLNRLNVPQIHV